MLVVLSEIMLQMTLDSSSRYYWASVQCGM